MGAGLLYSKEPGRNKRITKMMKQMKDCKLLFSLALLIIFSNCSNTPQQFKESGRKLPELKNREIGLCMEAAVEPPAKEIRARIDIIVNENEVSLIPLTNVGGFVYNTDSETNIRDSSYLIFTTSNASENWQYSEFEIISDKNCSVKFTLSGVNSSSKQFKPEHLIFYDLQIEGANYKPSVVIDDKIGSGGGIGKKSRLVHHLNLEKNKSVKACFWYRLPGINKLKQDELFLDLTSDVNYKESYSKTDTICDYSGCKFQIKSCDIKVGGYPIVLTKNTGLKVKNIERTTIKHDIPINPYKHLYLLHTCSGAKTPGEVIGNITINYMNGFSDLFRVVNRRDVSDKEFVQELPNGRVVTCETIDKNQRFQISRFDLDSIGEGIVSLFFEAEGNSIWSILGATLSNETIEFPEFKTMPVSTLPGEFRADTFSTIPVPFSPVWNMKLKNKFLYLAQHDKGFSIYNLRKPEKPKLIFSENTGKGLMCYSIDLLDNYMFANYRRGWNSPGNLYGIIASYDISDPFNPKFLGSFESWSENETELGFMPTTTSVFKQNGKSYMAIAGNANFKSNLTGMVLLNITDPGNMKLAGAYSSRKEGVTPHGLCLSPDNKYVLTGNYVSPNKFQIFDIQNPDEPKLAGQCPGPPSRTWQVAVYKKRFAYISLLGSGIAMYDIRDIHFPWLQWVYYFPDNYLGAGALYDEPPLELHLLKKHLLASNSELGYAVMRLDTLNGGLCFEGNILPEGANGIFRSLVWDDDLLIFANGNNQHPAFRSEKMKIFVCKMLNRDLIN
jgi:hypothetical protein